MKTVPCDNDVALSVTGPLRHLCPYRDEADDGTVSITWRCTGSTFELHALAEYLRGYDRLTASHEAVTDRIRDELSNCAGVEQVWVETTWQTAGFVVKVAG